MKKAFDAERTKVKGLVLFGEANEAEQREYEAEVRDRHIDVEPVSDPDPANLPEVSHPTPPEKATDLQEHAEHAPGDVPMRDVQIDARG